MLTICRDHQSEAELAEGACAMTSGGYAVDIQALLNGAAAYKSQGGDIHELLWQWQRTADLPSSAFGNLAVSSQMASGYEKFFSQVTDEITTLYQELQKGSESLVKASATYWVAEKMMTGYLQFLNEVMRDNKYLTLVDSGKEP
jgi:hypothetical protein